MINQTLNRYRDVYGWKSATKNKTEVEANLAIDYGIERVPNLSVVVSIYLNHLS